MDKLNNKKGQAKPTNGTPPAKRPHSKMTKHNSTNKASSSSSSKSATASAPNNAVGNYSYTALTPQALAAIEQRSADVGINKPEQEHALPGYENTIAFGRYEEYQYGRYNDYVPVSPGVPNVAVDEGASAGEVNNQQDVVPSSTTGTLAQYQTSSVRAEPEYEQYSYADISPSPVFSTWGAPSSNATSWGNDLSGVGSDLVQGGYMVYDDVELEE